MSLYRGKTKKRQMLEVDKQPWLPQQVQVTLHALMGAAKEGLLALAVAVGLDVLRSMMEAEVTAIVGPKGKHNPNRKAFRHGAEEGRVVLGGRKVPIQRPRVRTKDGQEVRLSSYEAFQDEQLLTQAALERMLHGLSTRRYHHGLEPVGDDLPAVATSKSSVSRHFVAATRKALAELLARPLGDQRYLVLMLDGIEVADHTVVVALGITDDGQKQILGLWEGATENATVCRALLTDLVERGLRVDGGILVVIDGAKALRAAVRDVLGARATVQRCQVHKKRNVLDHLPDEARRVGQPQAGASLEGDGLREGPDCSHQPGQDPGRQVSGRRRQPARGARGDPDRPAAGTARGAAQDSPFHEPHRVRLREGTDG